MLIAQRVFWTTTEKQQKANRALWLHRKYRKHFICVTRSPSPEQLDARRDSSREHSPHEEEESTRTPARLITEQVYGLLLIWSLTVSSVQSSRSVVSDSATPWTAAPQASLSFTNSQSLLKLVSNWGGDAIQPISSSVIPFSSCLQSFPASGSFEMS